MTQTQQNHKGFSFLYRTRIKLKRGDTVILNLSILFMLLTVFSAPWLAVAGLVFALALGYRFSLERNAAEFEADWDEVVKNAAQNVKSAVDSVVETPDDEA